MKRRILSDKYIDSEIAKIDAMFENINNTPYGFPHQLDRCEGEYIYMTKEIKSKLNKYIKQRIDKSYIQGFWYGWSLRDGMKDTE